MESESGVNALRFLFSRTTGGISEACQQHLKPASGAVPGLALKNVHIAHVVTSIHISKTNRHVFFSITSLSTSSFLTAMNKRLQNPFYHNFSRSLWNKLNGKVQFSVSTFRRSATKSIQVDSWPHQELSRL